MGGRRGAESIDTDTVGQGGWAQGKLVDKKPGAAGCVCVYVKRWRE